MKLIGPTVNALNIDPGTLAIATDLPVTVAQDPLSCVVLGTGKLLDELELLRKVAVRS